MQLTESEIERAIGRFLASKAPLPPEISLNRAGSSFFRLQMLLELYGVSEHPVVRIIRRNKVSAGMAHAIDHGAAYDHRVAHYLSSKGYKGTLQAFVLTGLTDTSPSPTDEPSMEGILLSNQPDGDPEPEAGVETAGDLTGSGNGAG